MSFLVVAAVKNPCSQVWMGIAEAIKLLWAFRISIILNDFTLLGAPRDSGISLETVLEVGPSSFEFEPLEVYFTLGSFL